MFSFKVSNFFYDKFFKYLTPCYIPKDATQQDLFLSKYPSYDGRGIKIAIIDCGIDVSLEGLQKTSEGLPKIIDCFDFTGAGDVDTSVIKEMDSKNYLIGLSGRKFKIPQKWVNPSGKWHLGLKALFKPSMLAPKIPEKLSEIDCIVWFDGQKWCVCIETSEGDLEKAKVLTNFCDSHEYGVFILKKIKIVYCITVKNDGHLLQIFTPYNAHGSGVAQIAAANFPRNPERNGLAPGAQIISMSVVGPENTFSIYPEKMKAVKNALLKCIELNVDIINYSLPTFFGNEEIGNLILKMFNKKNILLFKGSGNDGPFYTSVGKIDSNFDYSIFSIGALLTSEMKEKIHNAKNDDTSSSTIVYYYSSKGPGYNDCRGLDFVAPGAAISNVPLFATEEKRCYVGTSYSSPNAAGAVACLLSGLKVNAIQYSPPLIKFSLFKTSFLPEGGNIFEFGYGIIQINSAFEYFCNNNNMIDFKSVPIWLNKSVGVSFTNLDEQSVMKRNINLSHFVNIENDATTEWKLQISSNAKNFVEVSEINENNSFKITFNTNKLEAGNFYFGEIMVLHPSIGSIYNIPVSIVYPIKITETKNFHIQKEITLNYDNPFHFLFYPSFKSGSIKCEVSITALKNLTTICCIQNVEYNNRFKSIEDGDVKKVLKFFLKNQKESYSFTLQNYEIQEICIFAMQIPLSTAKLTMELCFRN